MLAIFSSTSKSDDRGLILLLLNLRREIPQYGNQNFPPLTNGVYFMVIVKKTPLRNENSPITDPITKKGVAHKYL
jgi:hypothetical protein